MRYITDIDLLIIFLHGKIQLTNQYLENLPGVVLAGTLTSLMADHRLPPIKSCRDEFHAKILAKNILSFQFSRNGLGKIIKDNSENIEFEVLRQLRLYYS